MTQWVCQILAGGAWQGSSLCVARPPHPCSLPVRVAAQLSAAPQQMGRISCSALGLSSRSNEYNMYPNLNQILGKQEQPEDFFGVMVVQLPRHGGET